MKHNWIERVNEEQWILCKQQDREGRLRKLYELEPNIEQRDLFLSEITSNKLVYVHRFNNYVYIWDVIEYKWFKDKII